MRNMAGGRDLIDAADSDGLEMEEDPFAMALPVRVVVNLDCFTICWYNLQ